MRSAGSLEHGPAGSATLALHDHVAWCGDGDVEFARLAARVFAGADDDERLVLVGHLERYPWDASAHFADEIASGRMLTYDVHDAYRPILRGDPDADLAQQASFERVLAESVAAGYRSLRVVADNSVMLSRDTGTAQRWLAWEQRTDRWQSGAELTGVCWFDRRTVPAAALETVASLHPLSHGVAAPAVRAYHAVPGSGAPGEVVLVLHGAVESSDRGWLRERIAAGVAALGPDETLVLDLSRVTYLHHSGLLVLRAAESEGPVRHRGVPAIVARLESALDEMH